MHHYRDEQTILNKYNRAKAEEAEKERPFVGHRLWAVFYVLRGVYGRAAFLLQLSFKKQRYQNWREDSGIDQLLRTILPAHIVDQVKKQAVYGFQTAIDYLGNQFLAEAGMRQS